MRKPHNFQPSLLEFPLPEPRQKIPLCAEIVRPGSCHDHPIWPHECSCVVYDRMGLLELAQLSLQLLCSKLKHPELFVGKPALSCGLRLGLEPEQTCVSAVLGVLLWGAAFSRGSQGACCLPTSCGIASSPPVSAQVALPAFCNGWAAVFRCFYSALWYMGSYLAIYITIYIAIYIYIYICSSYITPYIVSSLDEWEKWSLRKMPACYIPFFVEALAFFPF